MNNETAVKIFNNLYSDAYTLEEKQLAIRKIIDMENHNGISKAKMLVALNWMWEQLFDKDCEGQDDESRSD